MTILLDKRAEERREKRKKAQKSPNGYNFRSFQPTKEQKEKIKALQPTLEEMLDYFKAVSDAGLILSLKADDKTSSYILSVRENVPYGQSCKQLSFFHSDVGRLFQQFSFAFEKVIPDWLDGQSASESSQDLDW